MAHTGIPVSETVHKDIYSKIQENKRRRKRSKIKNELLKNN